MHGTLTTASEVIEALGGAPAVMRLTGRKDGRVISNWKTRQRLPSDTFLVITAELERLGKAASPAVFGIIDPQEDAPGGGTHD